MLMLHDRVERAAGNDKPLFEIKASLLRAYESYCYQIAYYMLQDECTARKAAERALTELFLLPCFYHLSEKVQRSEVKSAAVRCALQVRKEAL